MTNIKKLSRVRKVYVITPIYITYTERLTPKEYKEEIAGVKQLIKEGAREFAYSTRLREGTSKVVETL